jgi:glyoxylase-like metal-dependent hydrolase (beta-lactamase superfamily II)
MTQLWGDLQPIPEGQLVTVEHDKKIKIGKTKFKALHTPGHAVHHIAWQLDNMLFTGDAAGIRITNNNVVMAPCPPPDINIEDWRQSIRLIKSKRFEALYLTHFGKVEEVKYHLVELEGRLKSWANWIKPYWENGMPAEEITPVFQDYITRQLRAGGVSDADLEKYESANPSWMSVAGLLRYWQKKQERDKG